MFPSPHRGRGQGEGDSSSAFRRVTVSQVCWHRGTHYFTISVMVRRSYLREE